ncbi:MAG TPA: hypothetical protein VHR66_12660 [Gemmataceae bacterium]|jgi:hypothetical protein|nr:hypothetical protein [Gemmataceae bacterium]
MRYPRIVAKDAASAAQLKKRTLTNLDNERPPGWPTPTSGSTRRYSRRMGGRAI